MPFIITIFHFLMFKLRNEFTFLCWRIGLGHRDAQTQTHSIGNKNKGSFPYLNMFSDSKKKKTEKATWNISFKPCRTKSLKTRLFHCEDI